MPRLSTICKNCRICLLCGGITEFFCGQKKGVDDMIDVERTGAEQLRNSSNID